jgi:hypothetical protein
VLHFGSDSALLSSAFKVESPGELKTWLPGADRINDPAVSVLQYDLRIDGEIAPTKTSNFVGWVAERETRWPKCRVLFRVSMQS